MGQLTEDDFSRLEDGNLAWRWTSAAHSAPMHSFAICLILCPLIGSCAREQSAHEAGNVARRLLADGATDWRTITVPGALSGNFDHVSEEVAMPQAGSIVGFLVRHEGLDAVRRRWREAQGTGHPLGGNGPALEAAWLDELRDVPPATLDVPRVLDEGC